MRSLGPDVVAVVAKLRDLALDGDTNAAKLFLERILGQPRSMEVSSLDDDDLRGALVEALGEAELCSALGIDLVALSALRSVKPA